MKGVMCTVSSTYIARFYKIGMFTSSLDEPESAPTSEKANSVNYLCIVHHSI